MFLKRIEIKGFKSFVQKAVLEFPSSIIAIVGPNGSGKSNIVDAIRWALGEQSLKNIRVDKSEDLIFAGNQFEKPAGFAEVNLFFDNSDKKLKFDFSEIVIGRRLERDGHSEYFLNKSAGRLKEITEILADAQLGVKGFSIINQGAVENILRVSPQERRAMLIEILGLKTLELKKAEAQRKLENSLINLDKSRALKEEILPHLRSLKRQVNKWEKQAKVQTELEMIENEYFSHYYKKIFKGKIQIKNKILETQEQLSVLAPVIKKMEQEIGLNENNNYQEKLNELINIIDQLKNQKVKLNHQLGRLEGLMEMMTKENLNQEKETKKLVTIDYETIKTPLENIKKILEQIILKESLKEIKELAEIALNNLEKLNLFQPQTQNQGTTSKKEEIENYQKEIEELKNQIHLLEEKINQQTEKLQQWQVENAQENLKLKTTLRSLEEKRQEQDKLSRLYSELKLEEEKYILRENDLKRRLQEAGFDPQNFIKNCEAKINDLRAISEEELNNWENKIIHLKQLLGEIGSIDKAVMDEYQAVLERYNFLSNQINDLEKAVADLKKLIKELSFKIEIEFKKAIKEINEEFNRYFRLMFNGGRAHLEIIKPLKPAQAEESAEKSENQTSGTNLTALTALPSEEEPETDLSPGIEIAVNMPKAKLKGIDFLSGGEKALVAICLLFAIINKSSPPLLIMDEIDAALDESNSLKFAQILKELSLKTQFIIITHNRTTMEAAQYIYGVTLNEKGVSALLSLQFEEAKLYTSVK